MKSPTFRDVELLSAYLDGQLFGTERARLEARLRTEPALSAVMQDLRNTRSLLRQTPQRRIPHNFTLTPKMAGLRAPIPRAVPALSWASAVALLLFILTLGTNLLGRFSFGTSAPMMAAAPADNSRPAYGIGGGPAATEPPAALPTAAAETMLSTPTAEANVLVAPEPAPTTQAGIAPIATTKAAAQPVVIPWPYIWLGLAILLIGSALLIRWLTERAFRQKTSKK
jgi:anti-sigma factor RsiW